MNKLSVQALMMLGGTFWSTATSALRYLDTLLKSGLTSATKFHQEGIAFAREMGMNAKEAQAYTQVLTNRTEKLAATYGVAAEQIKAIQRGISEATSRQLILNDAQAEQFLQLNKLVGSSVTSKFTEEIMQGMGGQLETVQGAVAKAYATAAKSGLSAQKVSEKIAANLNMANKLSFRTGIDGLTRMAMQAEKVGMSLQSVEAVANNFLEIDDAISHAAQLQMLGGSAGAFGGNPMDMLYEANYDPEALQKRMTSMLGGYAQFDAKTGMASINGANQDFIRNIAKAMGIDTAEASRIAKKNAEVKFKESNINFGAYGNLTQEQKDFLINKSNVASGRTTFTTQDGKTIDLTSGQALDKKVLEEMMKYEGMSDSDIMKENARSLTSIDEKLKGIADSISAMFAKFLEGLFPDAVKDLDNIGAFAKEKLEPIAKNVGVAARGVYDWLKGHQGTIKAIASGVLGFIKFATEHWKILLTTLGTLKFLKFLGNAGLLGRGSVASSAARSGGNILKSIWGASKGMATGTTWSYGYGRVNGEGRIMSAIKAPGRAFGMLSSGGKLLTAGGAIAGAGIGAYKAITADNAADRGAGIGTAAGTLIGTALGGPLGAAIGGFLGDFAGRFIGEHWDDITGTISKAWDGIADWFKGVWGSITDIWTDTTNWFKGAWGAVTNGWNNLTSWFKSKWDAVTNFFGKTISNFKEFITHPFDTVKSLLGFGEKHAEGGIVGGTSYTGDKVLTRLNSGEMVLNFDQQNRLFNAIKNLSTPIIPSVSNITNNNSSNANSSRTIQTREVRIQNIGGNRVNRINSFADNSRHGIQNIGGNRDNRINRITNNSQVNGAQSANINNNSNAVFNTSAFNSRMSSLLTKYDTIGGNNFENNISNTKYNSPQTNFFSRIINSLFNRNTNSSVNDFSDLSIQNKWNRIHNVGGNIQPTSISTIGGDYSFIDNRISNKVKGVAPIPTKIEAKPVGEKEYIYTPKRTETSTVNGGTVTVKDFNININGTLKLDGGNSFKNIDMNELLNNPQFVSAIKQMVQQRINSDFNGGRLDSSPSVMRGLTTQVNTYGKRG